MNVVSLVSPSAKALPCGGCLGLFCLGFCLSGFVFVLLGLVFACLACLRAFTDWCTAHRQQFREQKKSGKYWPLELGGRQAQCLRAKYWHLKLGGRQAQ